jgi:AcrR family transcriptional regulator
MARRSDTTKAAILAAARERFAADGYERATIRAIAADAGIDPAMVMRYYGNKEKLFAVAAEYDLRIPDLSAVPREEVGAVLARHLLERWEGDETMMALLRAGVTNEGAAAKMRAVFADQIGGVVAGVAPDSGSVEVRAGVLASQVLGFALCRYVLRFPPVVGMSSVEVVGWLGPTLQRYLVGE